MKRLEQEMQIRIVKYLQYALPPEIWFAHYPAGGKRGKAEAGIMKAMGTKPGVPDLLFCFGGSLFCIELKQEGKDLQKNQKETHKEMENDFVQFLLQLFCAWINNRNLLNSLSFKTPAISLNC